MYEVADVKSWANLGLYFAEKLRGAVALQTYRMKGGEENKRNSVNHLENSLRFWDVVIEITRPIYNDMPLVYSEPNIIDNEDKRSRKIVSIGKSSGLKLPRMLKLPGMQR